MFDDRPFVLIDDDYLDYGPGKVDDDTTALFTRIPDVEDELPDGGTVDDIVVVGELRDRESGGTINGGFTPGGSGLVEGDPTPLPPPGDDFTGGEVVSDALCRLAELVEQLDGNFFGDNDGDGID